MGHGLLGLGFSLLAVSNPWLVFKSTFSGFGLLETCLDPKIRPQTAKMKEKQLKIRPQTVVKKKGEGPQ